MIGFRCNVVWQCAAAEIAAGLAVAMFSLSGQAEDSARSGQPPKVRVAEPAPGFGTPTGLGLDQTQRLIADAGDGRLDEIGFLAAALVSSGADNKQDIAKWLSMYEPIRDGIRASIPAGTATERFRLVHAAMHQFVLTGYYKSAVTDLRVTFESGDFNCLTSLVVYLDLCQAAGLEGRIQLIRGHVYLTFENGAKQVRAIEPGMPQWVVRPLSELVGSRQLSAVELLGKFYYNRGVERLRAGDYAGGLSLLRTSLKLDPADHDARTNLAAGLNNWAVERCRDKRYREAASLIEQGLLLDPKFAPLVANQQLVRTKLAQ